MWPIRDLHEVTEKANCKCMRLQNIELKHGARLWLSKIC